MTKPLVGKVFLVTGATRGIGRGIAVQLGGAGATVYITGRTLKNQDGSLGSLEDTALDIEARGGVCVPVVCDHTKDEEVKALFDRIGRERGGQLDVLVNNAYSAVNAIYSNVGVPFWEQDDAMWDTVNNVGLRNHYLCTVYASRLMVSRKQGLIINISSPGGLRYFFNVPYGIGKSAMDRMAADCAVELRKSGVAMVSLWPGAVKTETLNSLVGSGQKMATYYQPGVGNIDDKRMKDIFMKGESPEFAGLCVVYLSHDPKIMKKSGRILLAGDLASEYDFIDVDGRTIPSPRSVPYLLKMAGWHKTAFFFPGWLKVPYTFMALAGSKF